MKTLWMTTPFLHLAACRDKEEDTAGLATDDDGTGVVALATIKGDNEAGGFNGGGTGNKAIAGLGWYHETPLADFSGMSFEARAVTGTQEPYVNLIVDLACDGSSVALIVADTTTLTGTDLGDGFTSWGL